MVSERPYLRLVWSNPEPLAPRRPRLVNLAFAIDRHLSGQDGLSEEEFLLVYSGRATSRLSPVTAAEPL
jgi:hypothetical protein